MFVIHKDIFVVHKDIFVVHKDIFVVHKDILGSGRRRRRRKIYSCVRPREAKLITWSKTFCSLNMTMTRLETLYIIRNMLS